MLLGLATLPPVAQPVQFQRRPALTGPLACKTAPLILNTVLDQSAPLVPTGTTTASSPDTTIHCQVPVERSSARNWLARIGLPGVGRSSIASALTGPDLHLGTSQTLGRAPALDPAQSSKVPGLTVQAPLSFPVTDETCSGPGNDGCLWDHCQDVDPSPNPFG